MALLCVVPKQLRGQANAVSTFFHHLLGDFPSPYLIGLVNESAGMRWGYFATQSSVLCAAGLWLSAWVVLRHKRELCPQDGDSIGE